MHFNKILTYTIAWKLLNTFLLFVINLLMVRLLGATGSGAFFYDIALLALIQLILSCSLESGISFYASRDNRTINSLIIFLLPLLFVQAGIALLVLRLIQLTISPQLAVLFVFSNLVFNYFAAFFNAKKWFVFLNIIMSGVNLMTSLFLSYRWLLIPVNDKDYIAGVYVINISVQAFLLAIIILSITKKDRSFSGIPFLAKKVVNYSLVALISNLVFFLVTRIDYFFVQQYCSDIALSNYVQVSKVGQLMILVPSIIATVVFPYSAGSNESMPVIKIQQLCRGISMVFIPLTIIIILSAYWILPWVFGDGFTLMYAALLLYLPGFFALSIVTILAAHLAGQKLLKANLVASLLSLAIVVTGDILLIPVAGINAAALVSSLAYSACGWYLLSVYKSRFNSNAADFFSFRRVEINMILNRFKKVNYL